MTTQDLGLSWVDFLIFILVLVGMTRGRKRGMSQEVLDILKWAIIVGVAAFVYEPLGQLLAQANLLGLTASYIVIYALVAATVLLVFAYIRRRVGDKLMDRAPFGNGEYYLGMMAGAFRYACIIIVAMAFINARYYSPAELQASARAQMEVLGSNFFTGWGEFQQEVFSHSAIGRFTKENLPVLLIQPPVAEEKNKKPGGATDRPVRRSSSLNEVLDKR